MTQEQMPPPPQTPGQFPVTGDQLFYKIGVQAMNVDVLTAQLAERDDTIRSLQADKAALTAEIQARDAAVLAREDELAEIKNAAAEDRRLAAEALADAREVVRAATEQAQAAEQAQAMQDVAPPEAPTEG